ncbi:zinc finger protein 510-like [Phlebotomus papatasi]|uniref:zinc finger protein 510-like n=1 Tax=Phlebotomus papatasi TaxID=29031 RepID=UPI00248396C4|nr:zinc finger protein 510-like [Phlebotomus papatasi]
MKCLEAEIKISLILSQAKSQIDKPIDDDDDENNRLECLIELNTLSQPQEMEINLISSFINAPEILSIDNDDERGDLNFASNTSSGSLIEFNDQFAYDSNNIIDCDNIDKLNSDIHLPDPFANFDLIKNDSINIYPKCRILLDHIPLEIPLEGPEAQVVNWIKCSRCGEELNNMNYTPADGEDYEMICNVCRGNYQQNPNENPLIVLNSVENVENYDPQEQPNEKIDNLSENNAKTEENTVQISKKIKKKMRKSQSPDRKYDNSYEKCEICGIYIKTINICRHLELHENKASNKKYPCHICGKTFAIKYYANDHVKRVHRKSQNDESPPEIYPNKKVKCHICQKEVQKYFWKRHMISHKTKYPENLPFICALCNRSFISRETIRAHMITVHLKKKRYDCNICGEKFIHSLTRYRHINKFHLKRPVANCSLCSASFYHKTSLVAHRRKFHPPSVTLKCEECNAIFFDKRHLKKHLQEHFKNFTCEYCGDNFVKRKVLMNHIKSHTNHTVECVICPLCGITFDKMCRLQYHMEEMHQECEFFVQEVQQEM